jgi:hypothetical protein
MQKTNKSAGHNKKDKKRTAMVSRLYKLEETFSIDRDYHYRTSLQKLQQGLTSAHAGNNPDVQQKMVDLEEERDYELVRLRLWEEYQVKRAEHELAEDMEKANKEHDEMVKVVKERLYASLEKQVKQLKEDKVLLDLANSHSYNMDTTVDFHKNTRSQQSLKESSISAVGYASDRRPQRRRHDYTSAAEDTNASANESGNNSSRKKTRYSSADESWLSDGDLSSLLFGERREKPATRHSNKSYQPPNSLKTEEIIEDLILLRSLKEQ